MRTHTTPDEGTQDTQTTAHDERPEAPADEGPQGRAPEEAAQDGPQDGAQEDGAQPEEEDVERERPPRQEDRTRAWYEHEIRAAKAQADILALAVHETQRQYRAAVADFDEAQAHLEAVQRGYAYHLRKGQVLRPRDIVSSDRELGLVIGASAVVPAGTSPEDLAEFEGTMRALREHAGCQMGTAQNRRLMGPVPVNPVDWPESDRPQGGPGQQAAAWPRPPQGPPQQPYPLAGSQALPAPTPPRGPSAQPAQPAQPEPVEPLTGPESDTANGHGEALGKEGGAR
ncbi:hypothetical protein [Actinomadura sp. K4S16]|uniref:hypothetical protein n=1 Tax=Actinomadura sp. K4S16 TaxID=1316147 RepID=UPI0011ED0D06|nr:hypothetical protein [Actinomadura sp. K4S16]